MISNKKRPNLDLKYLKTKIQNKIEINKKFFHKVWQNKIKEIQLNKVLLKD